MKRALKGRFQMFLLSFPGLVSITASATRFSPMPAAHNTKVNQRDKEKAQPTADQQQENQPNREIARKIRRSIVSGQDVYPGYADNVKNHSAKRYGHAKRPGPLGRGKKCGRSQGR